MDLGAIMFLFILANANAEVLLTMSSKRKPHSIEVCEGEAITLLIEDDPASEKILIWGLEFSRTDAFNNKTSTRICQSKGSGSKVHKSYIHKVVYCNSTCMQIKNVTLDNKGYYRRTDVREVTGSLNSPMTYVKVLAIPKEKCRPVIRKSVKNVLNCTSCEEFHIQWIDNQTGSILGNQSILPISCPLMEVLLCCLDNESMRCHEGDRFELCTLVTPDICIRNVEAFDKRWFLLLLAISPLGILIYIVYKKCTKSALDKPFSYWWFLPLQAIFPLAILIYNVYKKCTKSVPSQPKDIEAASGKLLGPGKKLEPPIPSKDVKADQESKTEELKDLGPPKVLNIR